MGRLLILIFGIVSVLAVSISLIVLYRYANKEGVNEVREAEMSSAPLHRSDISNMSQKWLKKLAVKKPPSYSYAVSEVEIDLPLRQPFHHEHIYRVLLRGLDAYKLFCIRQLLKSRHIRYSMYRKRGDGILLIHGIKKTRFGKLLAAMRQYGIEIETSNKG